MARRITQVPIVGEQTADQVPKGGGTVGVSTVSNSDGTLTISPTAGAVVASINLAHANDWTATQTVQNAASFGFVATNTSHVAGYVAEYLGNGTGIADADATFQLKTTVGALGEFLGTPTSTSVASSLYTASQVVLQGLSTATGGIGLFAKAAAPIIFATGGTAPSNERMRITSSNITYGAAGAVSYSWDIANARLNLGTAPSVAGNDFYLQKTVNGQVGGFVQNASTGTAGFSVIGALNSGAGMEIQKYSTGFSAAGLITASSGLLKNGSGTMVVTNTSNNDIIFAINGTASTQELARLTGDPNANGAAYLRVKTNSTGTAAFSAVVISNSSGINSGMSRTSTGWATSGLLAPNTFQVYSNLSGAAMNIATNAARINFSIDLFATAVAFFDTSGNFNLADGKNVVVNTSTGTKIGTATNQKLGFWNATPIVQPTTAIAAATFAANTSGIADDTATFDGYTIGQVVKALRNIGALA